MLNVTPTTTITIDNSEFSVDKMSPQVQQMVVYFDAWRQRELEATSELLMVRGALKDLQSSLLTTIQDERKQAMEKAEALGLLPTADANISTDVE